jgi:hypothetical protein
LRPTSSRTTRCAGRSLESSAQIREISAQRHRDREKEEAARRVFGLLVELIRNHQAETETERTAGTHCRTTAASAVAGIEGSIPIHTVSSH